MKNLSLLVILFFVAAFVVKAQIASGGNYTMTQTVVANGGANGSSASVGGNYTVEGTIGQSAAGTIQQNAAFTFDPGFWNAAPLAPTAASVTVGGRILTADGRGIRNVMITVTGGSGETRTVVSSAFGYYRLTDIAAGGTYVISVRAKRYTFSQPTLVRSVSEDADDINFTANNQYQTPAISIPDSPQP